MFDPYKYLRTIITKGYLSYTFNLNYQTWVIKAPTTNDIDFIESHLNKVKKEKDIILLARCIHSIDFKQFDKDRDFYVLYDLCKKLPYSIINRLVVYIYKLIEKTQKASEFLEAFCYENESRQLWKTLLIKIRFNNSLLQDLEMTQIAWIIWNETEDLRLKEEGDWQKYLFVASAMSQGVDKIKKKWKEQEASEERRREEIKKLARMGKKSIPGQKQILSDNDKLIEDMRKWLAGEEDEHDIIVREWKEDMSNRIKQAITYQDTQRKISIERREELQAIPLQGFSEEEIRNKIQGHKTTVSIDESRSRHVVDTFLIPELLKPEDIDEEAITNKSKPSLMEQISNRNPKIGN